MEIMSNVATLYKEVLKDVAQYSSNDVNRISTNPNNCQNIAQFETKATTKNEKKQKKRSYDEDKDEKEKNDSERLDKNGQKILKIIQRANIRLKALNANCEFSYSESTGEVCIKINDQNTNGLVREISPEKFLDILNNKVDFMGMFIDCKS